MADIESIRVVRGDDVTFTNNRIRTAVQAHSDAALDAADLEADNAFRALAESVAWAQSIGVEVPKKVRDATTILAQWQTHLADERKRRG